MEFLNSFFNSNLFNILPNFLVRKIRRIFKFYFVETSLKLLPKINYPSNLIKKDQEKLIKEFQENNFIAPYHSSNLIKLLPKLDLNTKNQINFLDFGGGDIKNYIYLKKNYEKLHYFYHDQEQHNAVMDELKSIHHFQKFTVLKKLDDFRKYNFDFINLSSVIQYVSNYQFLINLLTSLSSKYIFFSATIFFQSSLPSSREHIIVKQVNVHPQINYLYFFEMEYFKNLLSKKNYKLEFSRPNLADKKINFNNFSKRYKKIEYLDVLFVK